MVHRISTHREKVQAIRSISLDDLCDSCFDRMLVAMQAEIDAIRKQREIPTDDTFQRESP
jgi:hypothetical protein